MAYYLQSADHLLISIALAPLLMLRSDQSVELGIRWFESLKPDLIPIWSMFDTRKSNLWLTIGSLLAGSIPAFIVSFTTISGPVRLISQLIVAFYFTMVLNQFHLLLLVWLVDWTDRRASGKSFDIFKNEADENPFLVSHLNGTFFWAYFIQCFAIRIIATARHFRAGIRCVPENFRRSLFVTDFLHPAELMPGHPDKTYTAAGAFQSFSRLASGFDRFPKFIILGIGLISCLVMFTPAYLYRLSIKSTGWLYYPFIYIAKDSDPEVTPLLLADRLRRGGWEPWRRLTALSTLVAFSVTTLLPPIVQHYRGALDDALSNHLHNAPDPRVPSTLPLDFQVISPFEFLFQLDLTQKWWQYLSLAGVFITFWIWRESREMQINAAHLGESSPVVSGQLKTLKSLIRARNVASFAMIAVIGIHVALAYSSAGDHLPPFVLDCLRFFYGSYMPQRLSH